MNTVDFEAHSVEEIDGASFIFSSKKVLQLDDIGDDDHSRVDVPGHTNSAMEIVVDKENGPGCTPFLLYSILSVITGSTVVFGYNLVIVNEPEDIFRNFINESNVKNHGETLDNDSLDLLWTVTVSLFLVGGTIGALFGGAQADWLGRRKALIVNSVVGLLSGALMFIAPYVGVFELLMAGRFIAGLHSGSVSAIVPVYLTELAPLSLRGTAGSVNQFSIVAGGFLASLAGLPIALARPDFPMVWPFLFFPSVILPFLQFFLLLRTVESPRWLIIKRKDEPSAHKVLARLRGHGFHRFCDQEVAEFRLEKELEDARPRESITELLSNVLGWPLVICVLMQMAQQLSGINAVIYYSSSVFSNTGLADPIPQYASLGVIFTTVLMTVVSTFAVERAGRRLLMLIGISGMWFSSIALTICMSLSYLVSFLDYLTIVFTFLFVGSFSIGPGPIPWFIAPELSLPQYRPAVIAICTFANWSANLIAAFTFPLMQQSLDTFTFLPYLGLLSFFLIFTWLFLPETRGLPPEESIRRLSVRRFQVFKSENNIENQPIVQKFNETL